MTYYTLISWPEIQNYMHHERWNECIFCTSITGHPCPDCSYMVPLDLVEEINSNVTFKGKVYTRGPIVKGTEVLFEDGEGNLFTDTCIAAAENLPYLFKNGTLEIHNKIIGVRNDM